MTLTNEYLYAKFDVADSTVRHYVGNLRDAGLVRSDAGEHEVVVENLPRAFDLIEEETA